jgi:hypothetical protein
MKHRKLTEMTTKFLPSPISYDLGKITNITDRASLERLHDCVTVNYFIDFINKMDKTYNHNKNPDSNHKGFFFEWFVEGFLNYFADDYGLKNIFMTQQQDDLGIDGYAQIDGGVAFIQCKYGVNTQNTSKTLGAGDKIFNFFSRSQLEARKLKCINARHILVVTASALYHKIDEMTNYEIELISFGEISEKVDGDIHFWKYMRANVCSKIYEIDKNSNSVALNDNSGGRIIVSERENFRKKILTSFRKYTKNIMPSNSTYILTKQNKQTCSGKQLKGSKGKKLNVRFTKSI